LINFYRTTYMIRHPRRQPSARKGKCNLMRVTVMEVIAYNTYSLSKRQINHYKTLYLSKDRVTYPTDVKSEEVELQIGGWNMKMKEEQERTRKKKIKLENNTVSVTFILLWTISKVIQL
jgi:hypothetical protein